MNQICDKITPNLKLPYRLTKEKDKEKNETYEERNYYIKSEHSNFEQ